MKVNKVTVKATHEDNFKVLVKKEATGVIMVHGDMNTAALSDTEGLVIFASADVVRIDYDGNFSDLFLLNENDCHHNPNPKSMISKKTDKAVTLWTKGK